jgi:hypothetical protein
MPKSGQVYDPRVLERSALLEDFRVVARSWLECSGWPTLERFTALVEEERRQRAPDQTPVRFVPAARQRRRAARAPLELAELYDGRIALDGDIPCLESSYHDLFNALVWAAFPRSKRALHRRQFQALQASLPPGVARLPNRRTRERDALTLFDEGGSVLLAVADRPREPTRAMLFGHALMDHVCFESGPVRSAAVRVVLQDDGANATGRELLDGVDRALCQLLLDPTRFCSPEFDAVVSLEPPNGCRVLPDLGQPPATRDRRSPPAVRRDESGPAVSPRR